MPLYDFKNKETGEIEEHFMSYSAKPKFLEENPHLESIVSRVHYGDPFVHNPKKPPEDYNSMLKGIGKFYKGRTVNSW